MSTFALEAVFAKHGDALLLHSERGGKPTCSLIDGGPPGVYEILSARLEQVRKRRGLGERDSLPLELVLVSHIDSDHVAGILSLFEELTGALAVKAPRRFKVRRLWHNSFDDIVDHQGEDALAAVAGHLAASRDELEGSEAVIASVGQGRDLRKAAETLGLVGVNPPFEDLVMIKDGEPPATVPVGGVNFTVIGPRQRRVDAYRKRWKKDMAKILEKKKAQVAAMTDTNPFNLASIVVLAEKDRRTMLLTGDARGDEIEKGLMAAGKLEKDGPPFHVDLFKVPHHGGRHNVTQEFFERVTARHYIISGDGKYGNPHPEMLQMLADARRGDLRHGAKYTIHFTLLENAYEQEINKARKKHLKEVSDWIAGRPPGCDVSFRSPGSDSIRVDLGASG